MSLEPIDPETALELYLANRETEISQATYYSHNSRLGHFVHWCDEQEIINLNELTGRQLQHYRLWRRNDGDLSPVTEKTQMDTLRVFIRWLESIDGVPEDLSTKVLSPEITPSQNARDVMLDHEQATAILTHLEKYEYASLEHLTVALLWHTMMRIGCAHALDVEDYHSNEQYLEIHHRPETETPIKNQQDGERLVALSPSVCELINDWLNNKRPFVTDKYGREPLLTTEQGRASISALRSYVYCWSRPCWYGQPCPHDRDPKQCDAMRRDNASKCPSSISPHAIRRGSITHSLGKDMPEKVVSDRTNVSQAVIDQHYDQRTERERMEQRREFLE
ncbi:tyrosine-type recombinase/integrase [Halorientalis regularis]|uniref:Site-specific recombinase XerD n=1 Tax=Halorientalis regularis TaxID=660518 RepID=A0A1G7RB46_9EURY|nr:site-specific integrase [Halorientalis regularis]SDG07230.1 Site-specific recombinase XerD [Halorientalis regularis]